MMDNLATIKKLTKEWGKEHKLQFQKELREPKKRIKELYNSNTSDTFSVKSLQALKIEERSATPFWIRKNNIGTQKAGPYDFKREITTLSYFIDSLRIQKTSTLFWKSKMMKEISPRVSTTKQRK